MKVAIHQPNFLPWLGYFDKMENCDLFVLMDNVQFDDGKEGFQNRQKIKTPQGTQWLTIPTTYKRPQKINEVGLADYNKKKKKILNTIKVNYSKAPYFEKFYPSIKIIMEKDYDDLLQLNVGLIVCLKMLFHIETPLKLASSIDNAEGEKKEQWIIDICKKLGADTYLSGKGGCQSFINPEHFEKQGIKFEWQKFIHPVYQQLWGKFVPNLSAIDYLFNEGNIL